MSVGGAERDRGLLSDLFCFRYYHIFFRIMKILVTWVRSKFTILSQSYSAPRCCFPLSDTAGIYQILYSVCIYYQTLTSYIKYFNQKTEILAGVNWYIQSSSRFHWNMMLLCLYRRDLASVSWFHKGIIELFDMLFHEQREVSVDLSGIVSNCK